MSSQPVNYRLRISPRGRNVRLRVSVRNGLEIVVPHGYDTGKVPGLLERKKIWIRTALERAEAHRKFFEPEPTWGVPLEIRLPAVGKIWHVAAKKTRVPYASVRELHDKSLLILGAIDQEQACKEALKRWLMRKTRQYLIPRLIHLSSQTGLRYKRTFVKRPRTRWASCSRHRSISLNAKLLFLAPEFVDYVIIHELCHLVEMNHSKRFWQLVERHCPSYRRLDHRLREMWKTVPRWAS
jgi:predicted metal-dependent hydrolase